MTPTGSSEKLRWQRTVTPIAPVDIRITNEEILADLLYPVGRDHEPAKRRLPA